MTTGDIPPSDRTAHEATAFETSVSPRFLQPFVESIMRNVPEGFSGTVLDAACGSGHPTLELLERIAPSSRVIAIAEDRALLDITRRVVHSKAGSRVFFRTGSIGAAHFDVGVFDLVVACLGLRMDRLPGELLEELARVIAPGGRIVLSIPGMRTFRELDGAVIDAARTTGHADRVPALERTAAPYDEATLTNDLSAAGLDVLRTHRAEGTLAVDTRDFYADPVLQLTCIPRWRWAIGFGPGDEEILPAAVDELARGGPSVTTTIDVVTVVGVVRP